MAKFLGRESYNKTAGHVSGPTSFWTQELYWELICHFLLKKVMPSVAIQKYSIKFWQKNWKEICFDIQKRQRWNCSLVCALEAVLGAEAGNGALWVHCTWGSRHSLTRRGADVSTGMLPTNKKNTMTLGAGLDVRLHFCSPSYKNKLMNLARYLDGFG